MKAIRPAGVLMAVAALVAGCAGDDSDDFSEAYNAAIERLNSVSENIGAAAGGASKHSNKAIAEEFNRIADTTERTRSKLASLEPPDDAKDEFGRLLDDLETGVKDLRLVAAAARSNDPRAAKQAVRALGQTSEQISQDEDELKQAVEG
jgi:methyl-accepting chemotaxis protein